MHPGSSSFFSFIFFWLQVMGFPEDDIEVNLVPRKIRTIHHVLPEEP
jgi:hypothetical protein